MSEQQDINVKDLLLLMLQRRVPDEIWFNIFKWCSRPYIPTTLWRQEYFVKMWQKLHISKKKLFLLDDKLKWRLTYEDGVITKETAYEKRKTSYLKLYSAQRNHIPSTTFHAHNYGYLSAVFGEANSLDILVPFKVELGQLHGEVERYRVAGCSVDELLNYANDQQHGQQLKYWTVATDEPANNSSGRKWITAVHEIYNYQYGVKHGVQVEYAASQCPRKLSYYVRGRQVGVYSNFDLYPRHHVKTAPCDGGSSNSNSNNNGNAVTTAVINVKFWQWNPHRQHSNLGSGMEKHHVELSYDKQSGHYRSYHSNGVVSHDCQLVNGELNGRYCQFNSQGQPVRLQHYKMGELYGLYQTWYHNRHIKEIRHYRNSKLCGHYELRNKGGQVIFTGNFGYVDINVDINDDEVGSHKLLRTMCV